MTNIYKGQRWLSTSGVIFEIGVHAGTKEFVCFKNGKSLMYDFEDGRPTVNDIFYGEKIAQTFQNHGWVCIEDAPHLHHAICDRYLMYVCVNDACPSERWDSEETYCPGCCEPLQPFWIVVDRENSGPVAAEELHEYLSG